MKVAVVTPTIASQYLRDCVLSVQNQTYKNLTHYIFIDGKEYVEDVKKLTENLPNIKLVILEENVGRDWYGHRVYAACSFLVNADAISYLDEDNWFEPTHIENGVKLLQTYDWCYSLRNITLPDGTFACKDECESLGKHPVFFNDNIHHIDTSCFMIKRDVAVVTGHAWYSKWGADRKFFYYLREHFQEYECTDQYTLNYRIQKPGQLQFFLQGNKEAKPEL